MQRLTAKFLLLLALVGTFVPVALAATAAPAHACCLRKAAHQCHGAAAESDRLAIRAAGCCNHDCCRAVSTPQWAHVQPALVPGGTQNVEARLLESHAGTPAMRMLASQSTRAPPQVSIA